MDGSQFVDLILQGGKKAAKAATKGAAKAKKVKPRITDDEISAILSEGGLTRDDLIAGYPEVAPPTPSVDKKTGKPYLAKTLSPQAEAMMKARKRIQEDIKAGNYEPYFDVDQRFNANPSNYDRPDVTAGMVPSRADTVAKYDELYAGPGSRERLNAAYDAAAEDPMAQGFYKLGQLEQSFIDELGPDLGPKMFEQRVMDAMAATTGGADPTGNLLMAQLGNYLKQTREAAVSGRRNYIPEYPTRAYEMPAPVGGRYASGNMAMYDKMIGVMGEGTGVTPANPKRYDFSSSFGGYTDRPVIDEQMMGLIDPSSGGAPSRNAYGVARNMVSEEAQARGVPPIQMQEVGWAGAKGVGGKPMISHYNEAIERTSRLTGLTPEEVVKRGLVRAEMPIYGLGGAGLLGFMGGGDGQQ
jgi:hypothetical protein